MPVCPRPGPGRLLLGHAEPRKCPALEHKKRSFPRVQIHRLVQKQHLFLHSRDNTAKNLFSNTIHICDPQPREALLSRPSQGPTGFSAPAGITSSLTPGAEASSPACTALCSAGGWRPGAPDLWGISPGREVRLRLPRIAPFKWGEPKRVRVRARLRLGQTQ